MRADKATQTGRILILPPRSDASGRPLRSWKAPRTRSLERLRYVAHAFQRAGSGGFPAASWGGTVKMRPADRFSRFNDLPIQPLEEFAVEACNRSTGRGEVVTC